MRLAKYLLLLFFALLSNLGVAHASPQLLLGERNSRVSLDGQFEYFQDSGQLDIQAVQSLNDSDFLQSSEQVPNFGFTSSRYWFRTQLIREPAADSRWILELRYAPLDLIGVFLLDGNGDLLFEKHGGDSVPFADRPIKNRNFTVALPLPPNEPVWLYVSVQTEGSLQLPAVLFSSARFVAEARDEQYLQGLYYGVLLSMLLYNLLIFASIRDASHLYYIFYIAGFAIFQLTLNGLAFEYLWPELPAWNNRALPITIALSMAALLLLTRSFLQTRMTTPRLDPVLKILFGLSCLTTILCLYAPYNLAIKVATASAVIVPLLVFVSGINSLAGGHRQARFFLLSFTILLAGVTMYALKTFHIIPSTVITEYGLQIGSALQMILLSFALADRMRLLKEEYARVEHEARTQLERRVVERTSALHSALSELESKNRILHELNTLDGLTGVHNRRFLDELLSKEWSRCHRQKCPLSVLIIDIDHFKLINDNHGHQCGDEALKQLAMIVQECIKRPGDAVCRYGGEEFVLVLPDTNANGAGHIAETVRSTVAATQIRAAEHNLTLTVSIGVGCVVPLDADEAGLSELIRAADAALYQAKTGGRNQVRVAQEAARLANPN